VAFQRPRAIQPDDELEGFDCGEETLNEWLIRRAYRNEQAGNSRTFVTTEEGTRAVVGYYATASYSLANDEHAPSRLRRNAPNPIPVVLIARLAVDQRFQGQSLGVSLLRDAFVKCFEAARHVGAAAIAVDAINASAVEFYQRFGFVLMPDSGRCLYIRMKDVEATIQRWGTTPAQ